MQVSGVIDLLYVTFYGLTACVSFIGPQEAAARADGLAQAAALVLRASGPLGFFKGVQARVLYQMPAAAICWLTYESLKHALVTVRASRALATCRASGESLNFMNL